MDDLRLNDAGSSKRKRTKERSVDFVSREEVLPDEGIEGAIKG